MTKITVWHGCYEGSLKGLITRKSIKDHPAKMSRRLCERIFDHGIEMGYWKPSGKFIVTNEWVYAINRVYGECSCQVVAEHSEDNAPTVESELLTAHIAAIDARTNTRRNNEKQSANSHSQPAPHVASDSSIQKATHKSIVLQPAGMQETEAASLTSVSSVESQPNDITKNIAALSATDSPCLEIKDERVIPPQTDIKRASNPAPSIPGGEVDEMISGVKTGHQFNQLSWSEMGANAGSVEQKNAHPFITSSHTGLPATIPTTTSLPSAQNTMPNWNPITNGVLQNSISSFDQTITVVSPEGQIRLSVCLHCGHPKIPKPNEILNTLGDIIVDPFAGVFTTGIIGAYRGFRVIGVELESKYAEPARANIDLNRPKLNQLNCPLPVLIQGDSRQLRQYVAEAMGAITSPPFAGNSGGTGPASSGPLNARFPGIFERHLGSMNNAAAYGASEGQINAMPTGDFQKVVGGITSPPYEETHIAGKSGNGSYGDDFRRTGKGPRALGQMVNENYGDTSGQIGREKGETYWQACAEVYAETFALLPIGGTLAVVVKNFIKKGRRVPLCDQTCQLLEAIGFVVVERCRAMQVRERHSIDLFGQTHTKKVERKSFFRRNAEKKGAPPIDYEEALFARKL